MKINKFYAAYGIRHWVTPKDIFDSRPTYEEALELARNELVDDDDCGVFINVNNKWYYIFRRDKITGNFVIASSKAEFDKAFVSNWK